MPMVQIKFALAPVHTSDHADIEVRIAALAASLANEKLGKDPDVTAVLVEQVDGARWYCGGRSLAEQGAAGLWLDIRVTEGTNTKSQKAAFIAATFAAMAELLGPLHHESYVHVLEARGDAYGYGGATQDERRFRSASR